MSHCEKTLTFEDGMAGLEDWGNGLAPFGQIFAAEETWLNRYADIENSCMGYNKSDKKI